MSLRTEEAYLGWAKRFYYFHGKRHPSEMGAAEITAFLTALAVKWRLLHVVTWLARSRAVAATMRS